MKKLKHIFEYIPLYLIYRLCRWLGFRRASNLGGLIGRTFGYWYACLAKIADKNVTRVFPEATAQEREHIIRQAADNFGRTFFEYFVLDIADQDSAFKCSCVNYDQIKPYLSGDRPIMLFSAHLGNWEIGAKNHVKQGFRLTPIYRVINNPYVDALIHRCRGSIVTHQIPKGKGSGMASIRALKAGHHMVVLADQKYNEGILIPFFGHDAKTADGFVKLAIAANALIIPVHVIRHNQTEFTVHYSTDILDPTTHSVEECLLKVNQHIENWIRDYPDQWFWFHRRWDKSFYKGKRP